MENNVKEPNEIYETIGKLIWSIFPEEGIEAIYKLQVYDSSTEYTFYWLDSNGEKSYHAFDDSSADEILDKIEEQLKLLQKHKLFEKEPWTQCRVTLGNEGEFNIKFAYIPWEDSWPRLYMKGVSEISYEEAREHCSIPKEEWEKRQKFKK